MNTKSWAVATLFGLGIALDAAGSPAPPRNSRSGTRPPTSRSRASDGKTYKLADFKGKKAVVIAWFPKAFTGGCTAECKSFQANNDKLKETNVAYFTASVDAVDGDKGNAAFAKSLGLEYPILSDPDKSTAKAYGVLNPAGYLRPALDVLHRQGRHHQGDRQEARHRQGRREPRSARSRASASAAEKEPIDVGNSNLVRAALELSPGRSARRELLEPARLQLAQDPPEQPAVHPARRPGRTRRRGTSRARCIPGGGPTSWRNVSKSSSKRPASEVPVVRVDPHEPTGPVISAQNPVRGPGVDVDREVDLASVDQGRAGSGTTAPSAEIGGSKDPPERPPLDEDPLDARRSDRLDHQTAADPLRACSARWVRSNWPGSMSCRPPLGWTSQ